MSTFFDSKQVFVHWDGGTDAATVQWKRAADGDVFKEGMDKGLGLATKKRAQRLVADQSILGTLSQEDESWMIKDWMPRLAKVGVTRLAIVISKKNYRELPKVRQKVKLSGTNLVVHFFGDMDNAKLWARDAQMAA